MDRKGGGLVVWWMDAMLWGKLRSWCCHSYRLLEFGNGDDDTPAAVVWQHTKSEDVWSWRNTQKREDDQSQTGRLLKRVNSYSVYRIDDGVDLSWLYGFGGRLFRNTTTVRSFKSSKHWMTDIIVTVTRSSYRPKHVWLVHKPTDRLIVVAVL